jgi:hypothetical protein
MKRLVPYLSLFTSFSTLICCALPALLVALGMGAALASTVSTFPQLIWISEHKTGVFIVAGIMLTLTFVMRRYSADRSCPIDSELAAACTQSRKYSALVFGFSCAMYLVGAFFAFIAPYFYK